MSDYCERLSQGFSSGLWAEPVNALTNLAFVLAALLMWRRSAPWPVARLLCILLFAIGIGSGLFHTLATRWSSLADTLPILLFILVYLFAASRDMLGLPRSVSAVITLAFIPITALLAPWLAQIPLYGRSAAYLPVPVLIALYALLMVRRNPVTARGLAIGAGLLWLSLTFRSLDRPLCTMTDGIGTHFLWHLLNAALLAWMIETYRRHMLASLPAGR